MQSKLDKAIKKLHNEKLSCVVFKGDENYISTDSGIKPLMIFLRQDKNFFKNAVIADKIIGRAAALLMILGGVEQVYGEVMSETAIEVLKENNIIYKYGETVPYIKNRTDTGMCPMEETVKDISSPEKAFIELEKTIAILMSKK